MTSKRGGFWYDVSDEQLSRFARMTIRQRLEWVDDARLFTLAAMTPETRRRHALLRRGLSLDDTLADDNSR